MRLDVAADIRSASTGKRPRVARVRCTECKSTLLHLSHIQQIRGCSVVQIESGVGEEARKRTDAD